LNISKQIASKEPKVRILINKIGERKTLQKEWDRNEKFMSLKKAILNRKIKPYNIEAYLSGLSSQISAKDFKQLTLGTKIDPYKQFFVASAKPTATFPAAFKLSYDSCRKIDSNALTVGDPAKLGNTTGRIKHRKAVSVLPPIDFDLGMNRRYGR
jgi:hypothetical protein